MEKSSKMENNIKLNSGFELNDCVLIGHRLTELVTEDGTVMIGTKTGSSVRITKEGCIFINEEIVEKNDIEFAEKFKSGLLKSLESLKVFV